MNLSRQWWRSKTFISNRCVRYLQLLILKTLNYAQRRDRDDVINKHLTSIIHSESFLPSLVFTLRFNWTEKKKKNSRDIWHEFDPRPLLERSFASKTTTAERTSNLHIKERKTVFFHAENKRFPFFVQFAAVSCPINDVICSAVACVDNESAWRQQIYITKALIQILFEPRIVSRYFASHMTWNILRYRCRRSCKSFRMTRTLQGNLIPSGNDDHKNSNKKTP